MDRCHDELPDLRRGVAGEVHILRRVVPGPDRRDVVRRVADEIAVAVGGRRTGFAGDGHVAQARLGAGTGVDGVIKHVGHVPRGVRLEGDDGARRVFQHDVARRIRNIVVRAGVGEDAVVDESAVRLRHLAHGDAVRELAEGERGIVAVRVDHTRDAELGLQEFKRRARREFIEDLCRYGVQRALQTLADGDDAVVAAAGVARVPGRAGELDVRAVVHLRVLRDQPQLHGRTVDGDRLEGRSGRALGLRGAVQTKVDGLFARAAGETLDLARIRVEDDDGGLELLPLGRRVLRQIIQIRIVFVDHALDTRVVAGVDLIAAGIQQGLRRVVADALLLHEVLQHVLNDGLGIVAVDRLVAAAALAVDEDQLLGDGLVILLLGDVALIVHLPEDRLLPCLVVVAADERVVLGGIVRDADDAGALRERQLRRRFAEVRLRRGVDAVAAPAEVHDVQIPFDDFFFVIRLFEFERLEDLQQLALDGDIVLLREVLDELLRDGGAAEVVAHGQEHVHERAGGAVPVHALVPVKALVLNGDGRVLHVLRDVLVIDPDTVFRAGEGHELLPVAVRILIQDGAGQRQREVLQLNVQLGGQAVFHVIREDAHEKQPRDQQNEQDGADDPKNGADDAGGRFRGTVSELLRRAPGVLVPLISHVCRSPPWFFRKAAVSHCGILTYPTVYHTLSIQDREFSDFLRLWNIFRFRAA